MTEHDGTTIPIKFPQTPNIGSPAKSSRDKRRSRRMRAVSAIAFFILVLSAVGWGTWHFVISSSKVDDDESIADLEGFESASEFSGKTSNEYSLRNRLAASRPIMTNATATDGLRTPDLPADLFSTNEPATAADVWLTGTIEDAESLEKIELPQRVSGGPNESSVLR